MINLIKKNDILKSINVDQSFAIDDVFFLPVTIDKVKAKKRNISKIIVSFIPKDFVFYERFLNDDNTLYNQGYYVEDKPLHINPSLGNLKTFTQNNCQDYEFKSDLYKKVYSKNIVSSFGQETFINNPNIIDITSYESDIVNFYTETLISNIKGEQSLELQTQEISEEFTPLDLSTGLSLAESEPPKKIIDFFMIKVYLLNKNNEIIDLENTGFVNINELIEFGEPVFEVAIQNDARRFLDSIRLRVTNYIHPVFERRSKEQKINGLEIDFDIENLGSIYQENAANISSINLFFNFEEIENIVFIKNFTKSESEGLDIFSITQEKEDLSYNLLNNEQLYQFFISAKNYFIEEDLTEFTIKKMISFSYNENNVSFSEDFKLRLSQIEKYCYDYKKNKFLQDIRDSKVINVTIENETIYLENSGENLFLYKVVIDLNDRDYNIEDILLSRLRIDLIDQSGHKIDNNDIFYFDRSFVEDNFALINMTNTISNYIIEGNNIEVYVKSDRVLSRALVYVKAYFADDPILASVVVLNNILPQKRFYRNVSENAERLLGQNFNFDSEKITENKIPFSLKINKVYQNFNFRKLSYYFDESTESSKERIIKILNNTLVKVEKSTAANKKKEKTNTNYFQLIDLVDSLGEEDVKFLLDGNKLKSKYDIGEIKNSNNVFNTLSFDLILFENGVIDGFLKEDNSAEKQAFVNYFKEKNPNFSTTKMKNLILNLFNTNYFTECKEKAINEIFNLLNNLESNKVFLRKDNTLSNISNSNTQNSLIENGQILARKSLTSNQKESNYLDYLSNVCLRNTVKNKNISLKLYKKSESKPDFVLKGEKVKEIIRQVKEQSFTHVESYVKFKIKFGKEITNYLEKNIKYDVLKTNDGIILEPVNNLKLNCSFCYKNDTIQINLYDKSISLNEVYNREYFGDIIKNIPKSFVDKLDFLNIIARCVIVYTFRGKKYYIEQDIEIENDNSISKSINSYDTLVKNKIYLFKKNKDFNTISLGYERKKD